MTMQMITSVSRILLLVSQISATSMYNMDMGSSSCGTLPTLDDAIFYGQDTFGGTSSGGCCPTQGCDSGYGSFDQGGFNSNNPAIGGGSCSIGNSMGGMNGMNGSSSMGGNSMGGMYGMNGNGMSGGNSMGQCGSMMGGNSMMGGMNGSMGQCQPGMGGMMGSSSMGGMNGMGGFTSFDLSSAQISQGQGQQGSYGYMAPQAMESSSGSYTEQPLTVLLNGHIPVNVQPSSITVGEVTYPLAGTVAATASSSISQPHSNVPTNVVVEPLFTQEELSSHHVGPIVPVPVGTTAAQLKKDQKEDEPCKKKKKSKAAAAPKPCKPKRKSGVAGVSTLAALAILPILAMLL